MEDIKKIVKLMFSNDEFDRDDALVLTKDLFGYKDSTISGDFNYDLTRLYLLEIMRQVFEMYKNDVLIHCDRIQDIYTFKTVQVFGGVSGYVFTAVPIHRGFSKSFDGNIESMDVRFHVSNFIDVKLEHLDNVYEHTITYSLVVKQHLLTGDIVCEPSVPSLYSKTTNDEFSYSIDDLSLLRGSYMITYRNMYDVLEKLFKHFLIQK